MFAFFETRPCSWGLIFAVSAGLVNYLGTHKICLWVFMFAILKRLRNSPNKSLANINEFTVIWQQPQYHSSMMHPWSTLTTLTLPLLCTCW